MRKFQVITLFPDMFSNIFGSSMMWKAQKEGLVELSTIDLREFGLGPRKQVDDTPYGGGDGMLLMPEPLFKAVRYAKEQDPKAKVVLMTPRGKLWNQALAQKWAEEPANKLKSSEQSQVQCDTQIISGDHQGYIFICGHYEGYDERILSLVDQQIRVGNYILTGGELPAMTIIDSIVRLLPGVLGGKNSTLIESFSDAETLEYPQYTRPQLYEGMKVPSVLLSGNHAKIESWRQKHSLKVQS